MKPTTEKIHKVIAGLGIASRREAERMIEAGRVKINGKTAIIGLRISETVKLQIDGRSIKRHTQELVEHQALIYHKPIGEICTRNDSEGRKTVFVNLPKPAKGRWISVGRLDINSSGLMIFTTDGALADRMMHPSSNLEREYAVRVYGKFTAEKIKNLLHGVKLEDGFAQFKKIYDAGGSGKNHWYNVLLSEGRNREVRRLFESQDLQVSRLIRIRYGDVILPRKLPEGQSQFLDPADLFV